MQAFLSQIEVVATGRLLERRTQSELTDDAHAIGDLPRHRFIDFASYSMSVGKLT